MSCWGCEPNFKIQNLEGKHQGAREQFNTCSFKPKAFKGELGSGRHLSEGML